MKPFYQGLANGRRLKHNVLKLNQITSSYKSSFADYMYILYFSTQESNLVITERKKALQQWSKKKKKKKEPLGLLEKEREKFLVPC